MNTEASLKLTKARAAMLMDFPFFGTLSLRLKLEPMPREMRQAFIARQMKPTLAVDGRTIFYAEDFIESMDMPLVKSAVAHEVGHCVFGHTQRLNGRNPMKWNQATDYVINDVLKEAGFTLGKEWLYNPAFHGMSADQVYNLLPDGDGEGSEGDGHGGKGGNPLCDVMPGPANEAEDDAESIKNEWKVATVQAANAAQKQGNLPASLKRFVDEIVNPKVDWRAQLRRFITERSKDDYSWMRANRRFLHYGYFLPSLYSENMGTMVVVTDDSGSIGDDILQTFASEISAIRDNVRPSETIVISCDAAVNHVDRLQPNDAFKMQCHGGGGTDFRPPFAWLEEQGIKPVCLVYLTDLYGPFGEQPDYPVMWCSITDQVAPWGETIHVEI